MRRTLILVRVASLAPHILRDSNVRVRENSSSLSKIKRRSQSTHTACSTIPSPLRRTMYTLERSRTKKHNGISRACLDRPLSWAPTPHAMGISRKTCPTRRRRLLTWLGRRNKSLLPPGRVPTRRAIHRPRRPPEPATFSSRQAHPPSASLTLVALCPNSRRCPVGSPQKESKLQRGERPAGAHARSWTRSERGTRVVQRCGQ